MFNRTHPHRCRFTRLKFSSRPQLFSELARSSIRFENSCLPCRVMVKFNTCPNVLFNNGPSDICRIEGVRYPTSTKVNCRAGKGKVCWVLEHHTCGEELSYCAACGSGVAHSLKLITADLESDLQMLKHYVPTAQKHDLTGIRGLSKLLVCSTHRTGTIF